MCNLGALAARFVFKPVEESYYVFFAKIISRDDHETTEQGDDNADDIHHHRHRTTFDDLLLAASTLSTLLWFVSFIGVTVLTYGQAYSRTLLHLYGGQNLSTGPGATLLRTYCVYVLALAVNGIAECFVFATAPTAYLSFFNRVMVCAESILSEQHQCVGGRSLVIRANLNCMSCSLRVGWTVCCLPSSMLVLYCVLGSWCCRLHPCQLCEHGYVNLHSCPRILFQIFRDV